MTQSATVQKHANYFVRNHNRVLVQKTAYHVHLIQLFTSLAQKTKSIKHVMPHVICVHWKMLCANLDMTKKIWNVIRMRTMYRILAAQVRGMHRAVHHSCIMEHIKSQPIHVQSRAITLPGGVMAVVSASRGK